MTTWLRFSANGKTGFGTLEGDTIAVHEGCMFAGATATGATLKLADVALEAPCVPTKIIALWNNFYELAAKLKVAVPAEPLYLLKATSSISAPGAEVRRPAAYDGKTVYEGELGIVIGRTLTNVSDEEAAAGIFGYTVVNDITAADILNRDSTFPSGRGPRASTATDRSAPGSSPTSIRLKPGCAPSSTVRSGRTICSPTWSSRRRCWCR